MKIIFTILLTIFAIIVIVLIAAVFLFVKDFNFREYYKEVEDRRNKVKNKKQKL